MYFIKLEWHPHNIDLDAIQSYMSGTYVSYSGSSADYCLTLWFSEDLTDQQKADIEAYWAGLTEESSEAQSYVTTTQIAEATAQQKANLITKEWADMSACERKLVLGLPVTRQDLGL